MMYVINTVVISELTVSCVTCLRDLLCKHLSQPEIATAMCDLSVVPLIKAVLTHHSKWHDDDQETATAFLSEAREIMEMLAISLPKGYFFTNLLFEYNMWEISVNQNLLFFSGV